MEESAARTAAPRGRKPRLTHELIVGAGLDLLDEEGVSGLTVRALADRVDATPMALYRHFADKGAVLDAVAGHALSGVGVDMALDIPWAERLTAAMHEMHDSLAAHPAVVEIAFSRYIGTTDDFRDRLRATIAEAGLGEDESADALRALTSYVLGFVGVTHVRSREHAPRHESPDAFTYGLGLLIRSLEQRSTEKGRG